MGYGATMDGHGINPFRDTGGISGTAEVNGTTWERLQVGIRDTQEDHQLRFSVSHSGGVIFTAFNVSFNGPSALSPTYGRYATSIPINAVATDSNNDRLNFSPEGWHHMTNTSFCDEGTLANSSVVGSWVQFTVSGESDPSFWIYGVMAERHSLANVEVTGYKYEEVVYNESKVLRVGGFDDGEGSQGLVYQAPLFSRKNLPTADFYRVNMTLQKGALMIDFIRSMTELLPYDTPLNVAPPPIDPSRSNNSKRLQIILLSILLPGIVLLLVGAWLVWRYRISATAKKRRASVYIGAAVKEEKGVTEIKPYVIPITITDNSSSSTMGVSASDEKRALHYNYSRATIRSDQSSDRHPHRHSPTSSFGHSSSSRLSGESGTDANIVDAPHSTIGSSLLFSNTTSSREYGEGEEEEPMALSHEELARVFDRVTELRAVQGREESERVAVLAMRQPEALEKLARQIAGVD
ncbi:hypothetical protein FRC16_001529 [Serendipita sp. 398]|nr:hypothetical protein FRC16_001529 [Serendipita sp. 398]